MKCDQQTLLRGEMREERWKLSVDADLGMMSAVRIVDGECLNAEGVKTKRSEREEGQE